MGNVCLGNLVVLILTIFRFRLGVKPHRRRTGENEIGIRAIEIVIKEVTEVVRSERAA